MNGIDKSILATENFQVRLLGIADEADFGIFADTGETSFDDYAERLH